MWLEPVAEEQQMAQTHNIKRLGLLSNALALSRKFVEGRRGLVGAKPLLRLHLP